MKMDACAFSLKLRFVELDEGIDEMVEILGECHVRREDVRIVAVDKGRGKGVYHEVTFETDAGSLKWWKSKTSKGARDGTLMVEGEKQFFLQVMEAIMWRAREWGNIVGG